MPVLPGYSIVDIKPMAGPAQVAKLDLCNKEYASMSRIKTLFGILAVFLVCANTTLGQTSSFTYQGRLTDGGVAANGTYQMTFTLFDSATNGTQIGLQVVNNSVSVTGGVFTVQLDFGVPAFSGADRWLEVAAKKPSDPTFTTLSPRQQISSVPYAVTASNVNLTSGNNLVNVINNAATSTTISDSRLPSGLVRLEPASTQTSPGVNPLLNLSTGTSLLKYMGDGGFLVTGNQGFGTIPTTGQGTRMMWYPARFAFRAGQVNTFASAYWDDSNVGIGSVAFGENTQASGDHAVAAGLASTASGNESVALGNNSTANGDRSFAFNGTASGVGAIAAGSGAQATTDDALALGPSSISSGIASAAIGPCTASANFATCIGLQTKASGQFSTAIGFRVSTASSDGLTNFTGVIALGDGSPGFSSQTMFATANNQFNVRAAGGIRFFSSCCNYDAGVTVAPGGGSWSSISDRNMKENFMPVDPRHVLRGVLNLPISTWNYKAQTTSIRHMGAMAQDFYRTFQIGENDKTIATIDPDGVAFAAIQGLYAEITDRDKKIQQQQAELSAMHKELKQQQSLIESLRKAVCSQNPQAEICQ